MTAAMAPANGLGTIVWLGNQLEAVLSAPPIEHTLVATPFMPAALFADGALAIVTRVGGGVRMVAAAEAGAMIIADLALCDAASLGALILADTPSTALELE